MAKIAINIDIPEGLEEDLRLALSEAKEEFDRAIKLALARKIISKSKFTEKDADELSDKIKMAMHESLKKESLIL